MMNHPERPTLRNSLMQRKEQLLLRDLQSEEGFKSVTNHIEQQMIDIAP